MNQTSRRIDSIAAGGYLGKPAADGQHRVAPVDDPPHSRWRLIAEACPQPQGVDFRENSLPLKGCHHRCPEHFRKAN